MKPLPPYGTILHQYYKCNIKIEYTVFVYIGKYAYQEAKKFLAKSQICLCLPYDQDVTAYDWPIMGLRIIVIDTGGMDADGLERIAAYLYLEGAQIICVQTDLCTFKIL